MAPHSRLLLSLAAIVTTAQSARVHFDLDLTWENGAPNGQERQMVFVNGQFPGPPMILDEGDDVTVTVNNHLPFNTTVHFHGIEYENAIFLFTVNYYSGTCTNHETPV